jgi:uncharacterized protein YggE
MSKPRRVVVTGTGIATGVPDQCVLQVGLNAMADSAAEALDQCSQAAARAISALGQVGIEPRDVRTTNLSLQDFFDHTQQKVTARIGSYQLDVTIRRLDDAGRVVAALSSAVGESLQVRALQLTVGNPDLLRREARRLAVRDAQSKAEEIAQAAGIRLGPIQTIRGDVGQMGAAIYPRRSALSMSDMGGPAPFPVEPGEVTTTTSVTITYSIDDP